METVVNRDFSDDTLAKGIFDCLMADITKRSEMADVLGVRVKDIDNARKRLWRKMKQEFEDDRREKRR